MHTFSSRSHNFPNGSIDIISSKQVNSKVYAAFFRVGATSADSIYCCGPVPSILAVAPSKKETGGLVP